MPDKDEPDRGGWVAPASEVAAEAIAMTAALGVGGPLAVPFGIAAAKASVALVRKAGAELGDLRWNSAARMVEEAAEVKGSSPQVLLDEMMQKPETAQLLADALHAAADTLDAQKVSALARSLANGSLMDGTRVDSERLMIRALADLQPGHIQLLQLLKRSFGRRTPWTSERLMNVFTIGSDGEQVPVLNANVFELMPVLLRHGLAEEDAEARWSAQADALAEFIEAQEQTFPPRSAAAIESEWIITQFGARALRYLHAVEA